MLLCSQLMAQSEWNNTDVVRQSVHEDVASEPFEVEYRRFERLDTSVAFLGSIYRIKTNVGANVPEHGVLGK